MARLSATDRAKRVDYRMSWVGDLLLQKQVWKPAQNESPMTVDGFARELKDFSIKVFEGLPDELKCPSFSVSFAYYGDDQGEANAFAAKLGGFKDRHVVAISRSLVSEMHKTLDSSDLVKNIVERLKSSDEDFKNSVSLWLSYYTFCFITHHELGHIIRGHSGYQFDALKGPKRYYEISGVKQSAYDRAYHLCECDADGVGGMAVGVQLKEKAMEISMTHRVSYHQCLLDLSMLAAASICILFLVFDAHYKGPSPHYPAPILRAASVLCVMLNAVSTEATRTEIEQSMIWGIEAAFDFANVKGLRRGPYDLPKALKEFYDLMPELEKFEGQLKDYIPAKRKQTFALSRLTGRAIRHNIQRALSVDI